MMTFRIEYGILICICFLFCVSTEGHCQIIVIDGCKIGLTLELPKKANQLVLEFHSDRNNDISKLTDISENNTIGRNPGMMEGKDMWFPVIDLKISDKVQAVTIIENRSESDIYSWNSNFWQNSEKLADTLVFDTHLEHWENHLYLESKTASIKEFYLRKIVDEIKVSEDNSIRVNIETLSPDWTGKIIAFYQVDGNEIQLSEFEIEPTIHKKEIVKNTELSENSLLESLRQTVKFILDCQNLNPLSPTYGGLFLFYDLDAKTYRRSDWMWTFGPAIKLLIDAANIPQIADEFGYEKLLESARLIGEASLRFQVLDKTHPAYGLTICRYDPRMIYEEGFSGYISPADAHFLAGWGWVPLFEAIGDQRFLDAAVLQSEQIGRVLEGDSIIEQDFVLKANKWKNWTMDESGFGMIGFTEVHKHTQNEKHKLIGKEYIDGLINVLEDPNGLWYHTWHRNRADHTDDCWPIGTPKGTPLLMKDGQTARGNGWAMIGLLSAHKMMSQNDYYLNKAIILANNIIEEQLDDGSFPFNLYMDAAKVGISEKGTSLWSLLFYQLYEYTNDPKHLIAAQKSLKWCIENQYSGDDNLASGGIVGETRASGVVYRNYYPLICTYTMDWFGLAILEQLKLLNKN